MRPLRLAIADDDPIATHCLQLLLSKYHNIEMVSVVRDGRAALQLLHGADIDLVFLDVLMPELNGIDVLKQLAKSSSLTPPLVVIYTGYEQFAYDAYAHHSFGYLTKPLSVQQLQQTLHDAFTALQLKPAGSLLQPPTRLQFQMGKDSCYIELHELIMIEAAGNYVCLHLLHETLVIREPLKQLAARLPAIFIQVNRSALVNVLHVKQLVCASPCHFVLSNEKVVKLSRRYKVNWQHLMDMVKV